MQGARGDSAGPACSCAVAPRHPFLHMHLLDSMPVHHVPCLCRPGTHHSPPRAQQADICLPGERSLECTEAGSKPERHVSTKSMSIGDSLMAYVAPAKGTGSRISRRRFLTAAAGAALAPRVVPSSVLGLGGAVAPSNRIVVGCVGVGRMGRGDLREFLGFSEVQVAAVCDVDVNRCDDARELVEGWYAAHAPSGGYTGCAKYADYRELVARDDIDVVSVVTPDHWHAIPSIAAAKSGKDVFLQKPLTLTIPEGRALSDAVLRYGRILQVGSQQRSDQRFRFACELARNERIGKLHTVRVAFGTDPGCGLEGPMPVPDNLDYDFWLGPAPWESYTENRVHPQKDYGRPGWLRMQDYSGGMMTGWGAHHLDQAHWGMGCEYSGPTEIEGRGIYPRDGLWDVHGSFHIKYTYPNNVTMIVDNKFRDGITFEGSDGWVWVTRGGIDASPKSLLTTVIGPGETHLYESRNHKGDFLE
ncbi:MAG TPA: Gfo/Idh/MocA family oxidoreductase, partial [Candidatus Hydrogenedentes bacterium]|nr:Gfo/Idh/MocA family oxidoreductase [Candidatus Hydrogenedentota bacterium]